MAHAGDAFAIGAGCFRTSKVYPHASKFENAKGLAVPSYALAAIEDGSSAVEFNRDCDCGHRNCQHSQSSSSEEYIQGSFCCLIERVPRNGRHARKISWMPMLRCTPVQGRNFLPRKRTQLAYRVPFVDPREHYRRYGLGIDGAIRECLAQGDLIMRRQLKAFEENFARFIGAKYAVGLNSGYHALAFSILAAGLGPGDEVITVAHTFAATVSAIVQAGAIAKLIDVGPDSNMDMDALERAITPRTRGVLPVHLNGRLCDMERLNSIARKHDLLIIEDAAQAVGATYRNQKAGTFGLTGCFSFYPFKLLGGFGDGGAITTNDPKIERAITLMRYNGEDRATGEFHYHGQTALLDNVQAAVLDFKLGHLPQWIDHRRDIATRYRLGLSPVEQLGLPHFDEQRCHDVFQNYVIRTSRRDELRAQLQEDGIETLISWARPIWHHAGLKLGTCHLSETEAICREVLSLPMSAETTYDHVDETVASIRRFFAH